MGKFVCALEEQIHRAEPSVHDPLLSMRVEWTCLIWPDDGRGDSGAGEETCGL